MFAVTYMNNTPTKKEVKGTKAVLLMLTTGIWLVLGILSGDFWEALRTVTSVLGLFTLACFAIDLIQRRDEGIS